MKCQKCESPRVLSVTAKTSDLFQLRMAAAQGPLYLGYVPEGSGLGDGGDILKMHICLDCGQLQGTFPLTDEDLDAAVEQAGGYDYDA
jgi:hypothetical protein